MKKLFILLTLTLSLFATIEWQTDFNKAFAQAKKLNKPLFVFIERHEPPCRWCQLMKRTTLADEEIANYINKNFIAVRLVRESSNYPDELYPNFVPTIYVITPDERIIKKIVGYWPKEDFQSDLTDIQRFLQDKNASKSNN